MATSRWPRYEDGAEAPRFGESGAGLDPSSGRRAGAWARRRLDASLRSVEGFLRSRLALPIGFIVTACLLSPCLFYGLACDDYVIRNITLGFPGIPGMEALSRLDTFRFASGDPAANLAYMDHGLMPWYADPEVRIAFWRPLAAASHYLDTLLFDDWATPMYAQNIAWFLAACAMLHLLYRRTLGPAWVATMGTLLFLVDDSKAMPVGWISNRNGIMALFFVAAVLYCHDRWRRDGRGGFGALSVALLAVGMLAGEATVTAGGYLFAHALFMDRRGPVRGFLSLLPYGAVVLVWLIPYKLWNYGTHGSGFYQDPVNETAQYLHMLPGRFPLLLNSQLSYPPATVSFWHPFHVFTVHWLIAALFLVFAAYVLWPLLRRSAAARFYGLGMCVSLLPSCSTLAHDRVLFYCGIGGMALVALFFHGQMTGADWRRSNETWRFAAACLAVYWFAIHAVVAPLSLPRRVSSMGIIGRSLDEAFLSFPPDPSRAERDVVIVSTMSDLDFWYLSSYMSAQGVTPPRHLWLLTTGPFEADMTRTGERSIAIHPEGGFLMAPWSRFFTGFGYRVADGYTVELSGMTAKVLRTTWDGRPKEVEFTFDKPLEDASLEFRIFQGFTFAPFTPPAAGETIELPGPRMLMPAEALAAYHAQRAAEAQGARTYSAAATP